MSSRTILFVDGQFNKCWLIALQNVTTTLGCTLEIISEFEIDLMSWWGYDLVIVDASSSTDLSSTISRIRSNNAIIRILVFSPIPSWEQAREAMLAGAIDYASKSLDEDHILVILRKALSV